MIDGPSPMLAGDRTSAPATRHERQYRMRRQPIATQSDGIGMAVVAERYRIAGRTILRHATPRRTNPYGKSRLKSNPQDILLRNREPDGRRRLYGPPDTEPVGTTCGFSGSFPSPLTGTRGPRTAENRHSRQQSRGGAPPAIPGGCANAHGREAAIDEPLFVLQARRDHGTLTVGPFFGEYCRPAVCFSGGHNRECSTVGFRIDLKAADILV